jgi:hypothetical protein
MKKLPLGTQPQISVQELINCEQVVKNSPLVHKVAAEIGAFRGAKCLALDDYNVNP